MYSDMLHGTPLPVLTKNNSVSLVKYSLTYNVRFIVRALLIVSIAIQLCCRAVYHVRTLHRTLWMTLKSALMYLKARIIKHLFKMSTHCFAYGPPEYCSENKCPFMLHTLISKHNEWIHICICNIYSNRFFF